LVTDESVVADQATSTSEVPHGQFFMPEAVLAVAIAALSLAVRVHPGPLPGDVGGALAVQHALLPHRWLTNVVEAVSTLNFPVPALVTLAVVMVIFALLRRWLDILTVAATLGISNGSHLVLSQLVHRPRPSDHGLHILAVIKGSYSFPSGHVTYAVGVFGMLLFLSSQIRRPVHPVLIWVIRALLVAVILVMPVSRVLEGEHWPSDVLGGMLFGGFWLVLMAHAYVWAREAWPVLLARDER
jgi:membrane-associated phospholipid phosphatase